MNRFFIMRLIVKKGTIMNIVFITQDEPFYLGSAIEYLMVRMHKDVCVSGCVLLPPSPSGRRQSFFTKAWETYRIFGANFFVHYTYRFILSKIRTCKRVTSVLAKYHIPILFLKENINNPNSLAAIKQLSPDLLVSIQGNQIFKDALIKIAAKGCLNLHSAILPKYRGLMPTFWALKNGEKETGVSVFYVDEGIDTGPIIVQRKVPIKKRNLDWLIKETKQIGMDAILEAIRLIFNGDVRLLPNPRNEGNYFGFPKREM